MRQPLLTLILLIGSGIALAAQAPVFVPVPAADPTTSLRLELWGDSGSTTPVNGYDGIIRPGRADNIVRASGNVVVVINGTRITANNASWHWGSTEIELNNGAVRIALPRHPTSIRIAENR